MRKCDCPIYCRFCGAKLKRDYIGHYCPSDNCQWRFGVDNCFEDADRRMNNEVTPCPKCLCMTYTLRDNICGKCKKEKR